MVLSDGGTVHVRPIRRDDAGAISALHDRLSADTIYFRFFTPLPRLPAPLLERLVNVDYVERFALVAELGEEIVAVARYDALPSDPTAAEVAFVVDDAHQGRGLGSLLLEHLAAAARANGIRRFVADTLPSNNRMLHVFRDAGFSVERHFEDGVVRVAFPIEETAESVGVAEERERQATARSVRRLLAPRTVAVVGASRQPGSIGHELVRNLIAAEFAGPVYPVHPDVHHVAGVRAWPSVAQVPDHVDLAVVAVPADAVPSVVEDCARAHVGAMVVISSGFADAGPEGADAERRLVEASRRNGMRLVGPNSMGVINTAPQVSLTATFAPVRPLAGSAGFLSQSGALGVAILDESERVGLGISTFVSVGNKADVSGNDLLQYWEEDEQTAVVLMYLESFGNPRKFSRVARRVSRRKPIVVVKSRRNADEPAVEALFRQTGVIRVDDVDQLFDVARLLVSQPLPAGRRVAVVTNASGPASLAVDACEARGLDVVTVTDLGHSAGPGEYRTAIGDALRSSADAGIVVYVPAVAERPDDVAAAIAEARAEAPEKPVLLNFLSRRSTVAGLPSFRWPEAAALALSHAAARAEWLARGDDEVPHLDSVDRDAARHLVEMALARQPSGGWLPAIDVPQLLAHYGIEAGAGDGVECAVGVTHDESFGPIVGFRMGGEVAALLGDVAYRAAPLTTRDASEQVRAVRGAPLLFDERARADVPALEEVLLRVGVLADDLPEVVELHLDPVHVMPDGATVSGARVRLAPWEPHPELAVRRLR